MEFQFYHNMESGVCVAVESFNKGILKEKYSNGLTREDFRLNVGLAHCSTQDTYSRKIGRVMSSKRAMFDFVTLYSVVLEEDKTYWIFKSSWYNTAYTFRTVLDSDRVYFVNYEKCG